MRAAASSMASGSPSRRAQMAATAAALSAPRTKSGRTAWARSMNRATASFAARPARSPARCGSGRARGWTGYSRSPARWRTSRLVTSTLRPEHRASSSWTTGAAGTTCSKLSRTSSRRSAPIRSATASTRFRVPSSTTPRTVAMALGTSAGSPIGESPTHAAPAGYVPRAAWAAAMLSRVLPVPPGPVRVSRRVVARSRLTSATSRARPMKLETAGWRLMKRASSERSGAKSRSRAGARTWWSRIGSKSLSLFRPRSRNSTAASRPPAASARVASDTTIWPPWAAASMRAARLMSMPT